MLQQRLNYARLASTDMLEICFGEEAAAYTPISEWVLKAVPFILQLKSTDNGIPLTVPI